MKVIFKYLILLVFLVACSARDSIKKESSPQYVEVEKTFMVTQTAAIKIPGTATRLSKHTYIVNSQVPDAIKKELHEGQLAKVILPFVNSPVQNAIITKISQNQISARLDNQVHDLSDQEVDMVLNLKNPSLFRIPFSSIYSPLGREAFVFVVDSGFAHKVSVGVIQLMDDGSILVVSDKLQNGSNIVRKGLDNLLDGDKVISEVANEF